MSVSPIPPGFHTVTPYLMASDAQKLMTFMTRGLGAHEMFCMKTPDGAVMHAQMKIGDSLIMLGQGNAQWPAMPASIYLYVPDCDALYARALQAGGTTRREPTNEFYGDRCAGVADPVGNIWWIATHIEDVSESDLNQRAAQMSKQHEKPC